MTSLPSGISSIIFDLGGVIVDLSVAKTVQAFSRLSGLPEKSIIEAYTKHPDFFAYERGEITDVDFRLMLRRIFLLEASDEEIDQSWNAMLIDLPDSKLKLVEQLKSHFSVFVLSNTNNIHIQHVNEMFLNGKPLDVHFHKCYYSHTVGLRKPEPEIYKHVLENAGLIAGATIFLDDNIENIQAASALGIQTIHITHPDQVFDLVK